MVLPQEQIGLTRKEKAENSAKSHCKNRSSALYERADMGMKAPG